MDRFWWSTIMYRRVLLKARPTPQIHLLRASNAALPREDSTVRPNPPDEVVLDQVLQVLHAAGAASPASAAAS